jgi:hypothetical protein
MKPINFDELSAMRRQHIARQELAERRAAIAAMEGFAERQITLKLDGTIFRQLGRLFRSWSEHRYASRLLKEFYKRRPREIGLRHFPCWIGDQGR